MKVIKKFFSTKQSLTGQYFFMHIPKTAGTTFRHVLYTNFTDNKVYPSTLQLKENGGSYLSMQNLIQRFELIPDNGIVAGHYPLQFRNHLSHNVRTITFFRDPIERTKSHIRHIIRQDPNYGESKPKEVIEYCRPQLFNLQARLLGYKPGLNNFSTVISNMTSIDFVGVSGHFSKEIERLNDHFGWSLKYNKKMILNHSENISEVHFTDDDIEIIRSYNDIDHRIYNLVLMRNKL
jgi:hypothetical protein